MILGSDSHTRYGALGTMAVGEGGGELVKQLLNDTWDIDYPGVVAVHLTGKPAPYVGPQDVALAIIGAVFKNGYVKPRLFFRHRHTPKLFLSYRFRQANTRLKARKPLRALQIHCLPPLN